MYRAPWLCPVLLGVSGGVGPLAACARAGAAGPSFGWHYLSNATCLIQASFVFYGIACLIRLIEVAALFATFEENLC